MSSERDHQRGDRPAGRARDRSRPYGVGGAFAEGLAAVGAWRPGAARAAVLPETVTVAGRTLSVTLRRNARAKRLILRLSPCGSGVLVTAPRRTSEKVIADFLQRHEGWIAERAGRQSERVAVADGAVIPFRGGKARLVHVGGRRLTRFDPETGTILVGGDPACLARRVADFLRHEALADLTQAVERHAANVGLRPAAITLKDTRSRWGSCTESRRLSFSWRIVMAPPETLDYLAAHEVAHFVEMNHSPAFWALCRTLCPGMDAGRAWLKAHGGSLHAVSFG